MFIDLNDQMEIRVYYRKVGRHYEVNNPIEYAALDEETKAKFKLLMVKARELTWGLYNELNEESITKDNLGGRHWNYKLYKENKLRKVIVSWDAKMPDDKGNLVPVPISNDRLANLAPEIAEAILGAYDEVMFIGEDEEKK